LSVPPASSNASIIAASGDVPIRPSPFSPASVAARSPLAATMIGGGRSGSVYRRACSTV